MLPTYGWFNRSRMVQGMAYEPWSEGLTFAMIQWQRACDTNNDDVYDICDYYELQVSRFK